MMQEFHHLVGESQNSVEWWQMCVRAGIIFVYAVALYRLVPRKLFGSDAALDIVVAVVMGSSLSRALTGNAPLLPTLAATAALAILHTAASWAARRNQRVSWLVKGRPVRIVKDGEVDWDAMHSSQLGERDLTENLRLQGVERLDEVAAAYLERNGSISVIRK